MQGALSEETTGLSFIITAGLASAVFLVPESRGIHGRILLSQIRDPPPRPGEPGPHIYIPQEQIGPILIPPPPPPGNRSPFRCLLRLAGQTNSSRLHTEWPHHKSELHYDRRSVSGTHLGPATNFSPSHRYTVWAECRAFEC
jgi:hypothetical protein